MSSLSPRVSFGLIVLNGEPFTRYNLRSIYPFAHQIIVVEGASPHAGASAATDGHSADGTLEVLRRFKAEEDPEGKVEIVTAEDAGHPNGFWPGEKDEQSSAYAHRATGDYLWQVDIDEFYKPADVRALLDMLRGQPEIMTLSFNTITFWGGLSFTVDGFYLRKGAREFHRLFRFGPGYSYVTHRPPTVRDSSGKDLREISWVRGDHLAARGIYCYHYASLFPRQAREKSAYYQTAMPKLYPAMRQWAEECFFTLGDQFHVHNVYQQASWLERFNGSHPPQVVRMMEDIYAGRIKAELRRTDDIEAMLRSPAYRIGRAMVKVLVLLTGGKVGQLPRRMTFGAAGVLGGLLLKALARKAVPERLWSLLSRTFKITRR